MAPAGPGPAHRGGFGLIEVLVALAIGSLVTLAAALALRGGHRAGGALEASSADRLAADLAAALLATEIRRAGYAPADATADVRPAQPALMVEIGAAGPHGDAVRIRSLDDRVAGPYVSRDWRFDSATDGRGVDQLYRANAGSSRQPVVEGVARLSVVGYGDASGVHPPEDALALPARPRTLTVEVTGVGGTARRLTIELPSRPELRAIAPPP